MDLKDWNPKEMRDIITAIEFNYVYNGKESPFGKRDMEVLMKFFSKAEELKRSIEPQTAALLKAGPEPTFLGFSANTWEKFVEKAE